MKIKRSIFIKKELEKENNWMKITKVTKIKNYTNILKIRLEGTKMVKRAKQQGLLAYNLAISPDQMEKE